MDTVTFTSNVALADGGMRYTGTADGAPPITIDFTPGQEGGYNALNLVMISLSACMAATMAALLRNRVRKTVDDLRVYAEGTMQSTHPRKLSHITLMLTIVSPDLLEKDVDRMLPDAEARLCPVMAMLRGNTEVDIRYVIERPTK